MKVECSVKEGSVDEEDCQKTLSVEEGPACLVAEDILVTEQCKC